MTTDCEITDLQSMQVQADLLDDVGDPLAARYRVLHGLPMGCWEEVPERFHGVTHSYHDFYSGASTGEGYDGSGAPSEQGREMQYSYDPFLPLGDGVGAPTSADYWQTGGGLGASEPAWYGGAAVGDGYGGRVTPRFPFMVHQRIGRSIGHTAGLARADFS